MHLIPEWSSISIPVVGMLHAPPLPGSARWDGNFDRVRETVLKDAESLVQGGVHGLMLENFGDVPFFPDRVPSVTVAAMTALACEVRNRFSIPLGINMLRNDGVSGLAVAVASSASFIRVNVLCGARVTDQGLIQGIAHELLRERACLKLNRNPISILADVDVKHSAPLASRPLDVEVRDTVERGLADGIIVSGAATGSATDLNSLKTAKHHAGIKPVFVGSGVTSESISSLLKHGATGFIVGTSLKFDGQVSNPVDPSRVRTLINAIPKS